MIKMPEFKWTQEGVDKFLSSDKGKDYVEIMEDAYKNSTSYEEVSKQLKGLK